MMDTLTLDAVENAAPDHKAAEQLSRVENRVAVRQVLATLDPREQLVIRALFGIGDHAPMDAYDVSNTYLIPRSSVYALRNSAFSKMRAALS